MARNLFLLIGAQKSGTTSIYSALEEQKDIVLTHKKESRFFVDDQSYAQGVTHYWSLFRLRDTEVPFLDIDPHLLHYEFVPKRIFDILGDSPKFIVILRNPVDRAWSAYQMEKFRKRENLSFREAIEQEETRTRDAHMRRFSYLSWGLYFKQLGKFFEFFPKENFKFFLFEDDFLKNRRRLYEEMGHFMGINIQKDLRINIQHNPTRKIKNSRIDKLLSEENWIRKSVRSVISAEQSRRWKEKLYAWNASQKIREHVSPDLRAKLIREYFWDDILALEDLLQRDLSAWKGIPHDAS